MRKVKFVNLEGQSEAVFQDFLGGSEGVFEGVLPAVNHCAAEGAQNAHPTAGDSRLSQCTFQAGPYCRSISSMTEFNIQPRASGPVKCNTQPFRVISRHTVTPGCGRITRLG